MGTLSLIAIMSALSRYEMCQALVRSSRCNDGVATIIKLTIFARRPMRTFGISRKVESNYQCNARFLQVWFLC
jgi:hypothetical protein